jgi:hypothetical protein
MKGKRSSLLSSVLTIFTLSGSPQVIADPDLEHIASFPNAKFIESIYVRSGVSHEILLGTEKIGAYCGGGTPASIWKVYIDPATGLTQSVLEIQSLSLVQSIRHTIAESSDGTLFTGGGWCLYKPPYYSIDGGNNWTTADTGDVYPPNSTFSYLEFNGEMYAGTGYDPYPGEVYRRLGYGNWEHVFSFPSPSRCVVNSMQVHDGKLFVGSRVYGWDAYTCSESSGIYFSSDGETFQPTTGIPNCDSVHYMFQVGDNLIALTEDYDTRSRRVTSIYRWDQGTWRLQGTTAFLWNDIFRPVVVHNEFIYSFGRPSVNATNGIYRSADFGRTWQFILPQQDPIISALYVHNNSLLAGTEHDSQLNAHLYRVDLSEVCIFGDMNCDGDVNHDDVNIMKTYRNQLATECPKCDVDFDGSITILDMRRVITKCSCPGCVCQ